MRPRSGQAQPPRGRTTLRMVKSLTIKYFLDAYVFRGDNNEGFDPLNLSDNPQTGFANEKSEPRMKKEKLVHKDTAKNPDDEMGGK
jgi:hypothetical protein